MNGESNSDELFVQQELLENEKIKFIKNTYVDIAELINLIFNDSIDSNVVDLIKKFDIKISEDKIEDYTSKFIYESAIKLEEIKENLYEIEGIKRDETEKDILTQLEFIYKRRRMKQENLEYDDKPLYYLLGKKNNVDDIVSKKKKLEVIGSKKDKNINYEVRELLEGFICKEGCYKWEDEEIDEFIAKFKE